MTRHEAVKFVVIRTTGNFLLFMSLYGVVMTFGPALTQEAKFQIAKFRGVNYEIATDVAPKQGTSNTFGEVLAGSTEQVLVPEDPNFSVVIPKIGASARVFANIDPNNESEFLEKLTEGVAHAKGTVFPGMKGTTYLFAHSTDNWWNVGRYNAVFYLLKELSVGDEVAVFFEGKRYNYEVTDSIITDAEDTDLLVNSRGEEEKLVLQTCWPPGTTWKRLFVVAKPIGNNN